MSLIADTAFRIGAGTIIDKAYIEYYFGPSMVVGKLKWELAMTPLQKRMVCMQTRT